MQFASSTNFRQFFLADDPAPAPVDPSAAVALIQGPITDVVNWATNWGVSTGYAMLGVVLFYQVCVILVHPDK